MDEPMIDEKDKFKMRGMVVQNWLRDNDDVDRVTRRARNLIDNVTFDQLMDNFDHYRAAQCLINIKTKDQWYVSAGDFIKNLDLNDEDETMLKLAHG